MPTTNMSNRPPFPDSAPISGTSTPEQSSELQALKESEELFSSSFYQAAVGIVHVDLSTGRFLRANDTICTLLGYTEQEFCSKTIADITHPDDIQSDFEHSRKMIAGEIKTFSIEKRLLKRDGNPVWTLLTAVSVTRDENGKAKYGMAVCEDISKVKQAEQTLQESEERFRLLSDSAPVSIFVTDTVPDVTHVNRFWCEYTGQTFEQALGTGWQESVHPEDLPVFIDSYTAALIQQEAFRNEIRVRKANGSYGWILVTGQPQFTTSHEFIGVIGTGIDITDRIINEESLTQAKLLAEESNRKKSEFLSLMSHELRTPLNAIIGFSDLLKLGMAGDLTAEQKEYIEYVSSSGRHLLNLVNDLLDVAKIEASKMVIHPQRFELKPLINELQTMMGELAREKDVTLSFSVHPDLVFITADPGRFRQILINLISNGIKFNRRGGTVIMHLRKSDDAQWLIGKVEDTGLGISEEQLPELFNKFYQVDNITTRKYEGTGLGLALTKDLIQLHGGTINVTSQKNIGSIFTFQLPLEHNNQHQGGNNID